MSRRTIHKDMVAYIDDRLKSNTFAKQCIIEKKSRQLLIEVAKTCVGIVEQGNNSGRLVNLIQSTVGLGSGDPWCMAFVQTCIAYVEMKTEIISPLITSGSCMEVWNTTPPDMKVKNIPLGGAICIWKHINSAYNGHTGIVLDCDGTTFHAIEGNTSGTTEDLGSKIFSNGDGVYFTHRYYDLFNTNYGDLLLLGCIKPFQNL